MGVPMQTTKCSDGKWDFNDYGGTFLTLEAGGKAIAHIERLEERGEGTEEAFANAHLLRAGPALFEALQNLVFHVCGQGPVSEMQRQLINMSVDRASKVLADAAGNT